MTDRENGGKRTRKEEDEPRLQRLQAGPEMELVPDRRAKHGHRSSFWP